MVLHTMLSHTGPGHLPPLSTELPRFSPALSISWAFIENYLWGQFNRENIRGYHSKEHDCIFLRSGFHYVTLAGLELTELYLPLPPSARIKDVYHHTQSTNFILSLRFIISYLITCIYVWFCAHEGRCLRNPEMLDLPRAGGTGGCGQPKMGAENQTQVLSVRALCHFSSPRKF